MADLTTGPTTTEPAAPLRHDIPTDEPCPFDSPCWWCADRDARRARRDAGITVAPAALDELEPPAGSVVKDAHGERWLHTSGGWTCLYGGGPLKPWAEIRSRSGATLERWGSGAALEEPGTGGGRRWRWTVDGAADTDGTMPRSVEDAGVRTAEQAGEVVAWLAVRGPFWGLLDTDHPFTLTVRPAEEDELGTGGGDEPHDTALRLMLGASPSPRTGTGGGEAVDAALRELWEVHAPETDTPECRNCGDGCGGHEPETFCAEDEMTWPCPTALLLAEVGRLRAPAPSPGTGLGEEEAAERVVADAIDQYEQDNDGYFNTREVVKVALRAHLDWLNEHAVPSLVRDAKQRVRTEMQAAADEEDRRAEAGQREAQQWLDHERAATARWKARAEAAEPKVRAVSLVHVWTNEDGKQFMFADDIRRALGIPT